jgi:hypothetical protein
MTSLRLAFDLWETGPNKNAVWHCACVVAWQFWNAPSSQIRLLQRRRCGQTGGRLWKNAEVDHRVPLFRVWSEMSAPVTDDWPVTVVSMRSPYFCGTSLDSSHFKLNLIRWANSAGFVVVYLRYHTRSVDQAWPEPQMRWLCLTVKGSAQTR